ncbi:MAG: polyprenyl synthetase family protein [Candidatus Saganbacteria bacterium]|nr:polyprenyl synthetase family protein [Candidatus Saganbacteria bacterium]
MRYSVFAGGKRLRPILCLATAKLFGRPEKRVMPFACAAELVHTFTLIHDDLPAMDDAGWRRGKPASHKVFGEATAILAGDALCTLAFKLTAGQPAAAALLAGALLAVVEGQAADLRSARKKPTVQGLKNIHQWKTAALLKACVCGSAVICGASGAKVKALAAYAEHLGLAFQVADDILDVTSTRARLGKPVKADAGKGFPRLIGLEKSRRLAEEEKNKAVLALKSFDRKADVLRGIAEFVVIRRA